MKKITLLLLIPFISLLSCNKGEAGEGGTSSIQGKVYQFDLDGTGTIIIDEYYVTDEDVYIIYGDEDQTYNDKFATSLDGSYRFSNLAKGQYTLFAYSRCDSCITETENGIEAVKLVVEITDNKTVYTQPDLIIYK